MFKESKTTTIEPKSAEKPTSKAGLKKPSWSGILGVGLCLVIVSIAYSVVVILLGTNGITPKIMLAPQAIFAVTISVYAFSRIFK